MSEQGFRGHNNQRLAERTVNLSPQQMKEISRVGHISDGNVELGAHLEKAFQACAGMFRSLPFITMG